MQAIRTRAGTLRGQASSTMSTAWSQGKQIIIISFFATLIFTALFFISLMMFMTFYIAFMPIAEVEGVLHPVFEPCQETIGPCGFINANATLSKRNPILMSGQQYSVAVVIEMPESQRNQDMGMFMSCLKLKTSSDSVVKESCRSNMLRYRSSLLRAIETVSFAPLLMSGYFNEVQWVRVEYFSDYFDDPLNPAVKIDLQLQTRYLQFYSVSYHIHAKFSGLRYLMYYHPIMSGIVGVGFNMTFFMILLLLSYYRCCLGNVDHGDEQILPTPEELEEDWEECREKQEPIENEENLGENIEVLQEDLRDD